MWTQASKELAYTVCVCCQSKQAEVTRPKATWYCNFKPRDDLSAVYQISQVCRELTLEYN